MNPFCTKIDGKISKVCCFFHPPAPNGSRFNDLKINIVPLEQVTGSKAGSTCPNDNDFAFESLGQAREFQIIAVAGFEQNR